MAELLMPKLSDTMEEGTILQWMKGEGEEVAQGEPLVEIETDKANMVVEAPEGGALHIVAPEGETLPVGAPIAAIGADGAGGSAAPAPAAQAREEAEAPAAEAEEEEREEGTNIPVSDDGTGDEIGMEVGVGETYPEAEREDVDDEPGASRESAPPARSRPSSEDGDRD